MGEMRFLPFRAGPPPVFEGGGLEAGSELSAWTETSQAVWLAGGEPGQSGSWWAAITSAIDSGLSFPVPPEPKAH